MREKDVFAPGWASKNENEKVLLVAALQTIDEAPERTRGSQQRSQIVRDNSASSPPSIAFAPQCGWILLNLLDKSNYKQPVDSTIHQFVWSGYKIRVNYTLDAELEKQSSR